jgi:hypothetical protein
MVDQTGRGAQAAPWLRADAPPAPLAAPAGPPPWESGPDPTGPLEPLSGRGGALPWVLGLAAAGVLAVGGYVVLDPSSSDGTGTGAPDGDAPVFGAPSAATPSSAAPSQQEAGAGSGEVLRPTGPLSTLRAVSVTATCQAPDGVDSAGTVVTYQPAHTLDGAPATAWRCPGAAVGTRLTFDFGGPVLLASPGLVPGYAKIDSADGTDRFAENRTVTAVTWRFDDGTSVAQSIPAPRPSLAAIDLPTPVSTSRVVLEITGTGNAAALRDYTAISDVSFSGYR